MAVTMCSISSYFYQSVNNEIEEEKSTLSKQSPVLIGHTDYRKEHDSKFDPHFIPDLSKTF